MSSLSLREHHFRQVFWRSNPGGVPKKAGGTSRLHPFGNGPVEIVDLAVLKWWCSIGFFGCLPSSYWGSPIYGSPQVTSTVVDRHSSCRASNPCFIRAFNVPPLHKTTDLRNILRSTLWFFNITPVTSMIVGKLQFDELISILMEKRGWCYTFKLSLRSTEGPS